MKHNQKIAKALMKLLADNDLLPIVVSHRGLMKMEGLIKFALDEAYRDGHSDALLEVLKQSQPKKKD